MQKLKNYLGGGGSYPDYLTETAPEQIKDLHVAIVKFRAFKRILLGFIFRPFTGCRNLGGGGAYLGFTLAEVLITLSIIGVVAALTIPSLVFNNKEKETVVRTQKAYSVLSQAFSLAQIQYGSPDSWGWGAYNNPAGAKSGADKMAPFLNTIKYCGLDVNNCCPKDILSTWFNGTNAGSYCTSPNYAKSVLADGMLMFIVSLDANCSYFGTKTCSNIVVDVNGEKKPNALGKDMFTFYVTKDGIVPSGIPQDALSDISTCRTVGQSCTAWIILKGNMDYIKKDVSWD